MEDGGGIVEEAHTADAKPYHSKRPHKKSRAGCKNCKQRKVKCSEEKPSCRTCRLRGDTCVYGSSPAVSRGRSPPWPRSHARPESDPGLGYDTGNGNGSPGGSPGCSPGGSSSINSHSPGDSTTSHSLVVAHHHRQQQLLQQPILLFEPLARGPGADEVDMKLLWFYTTKGFNSFSVNTGVVPEIDEILQVKIPQHAFSSQFLMDCVLGLSALNMHFLHQNTGIPPLRAITYRVRACEGYRRAVEEARPETFPALLASSLLLCALSTEAFREPEARPFYVLDWMVLWRGIGLIVDMIQPSALFESGMALLFVRPPIDMEAAARHIPNNLLLMLTSLKAGDDDYPILSAYYDTLRVLGGIYMDLKEGFSDMTELRIITFFTFLPQPFVEAARRKRPRALVVIAHWLAFAKLSNAWWMNGISDREIYHICHFLGHEWQPLLRVPRAAVHLTGITELGRLLLDKPDWEPGNRTLADVAPANLPTLVNDDGTPVKLSGALAKYSITTYLGTPSPRSAAAISSPSPAPSDVTTSSLSSSSSSAS